MDRAYGLHDSSWFNAKFNPEHHMVLPAFLGIGSSPEYCQGHYSIPKIEQCNKDKTIKWGEYIPHTTKTDNISTKDLRTLHFK